MGDVAIIKRQRGSGKGSAPSIKPTTTTTEVKGAKQSGNVGGPEETAAARRAKPSGCCCRCRCCCIDELEFFGDDGCCGCRDVSSSVGGRLGFIAVVVVGHSISSGGGAA